MIVVTGAGGFIGGHLVGSLLDDGLQVRAVDCKPFSEWYQLHESQNLVADLREADACMDALSGATEVYDLAADMGGIGFIEGHRAECMMSVLISAHLLQAAEMNDVERFFYASSACVYAAEHQTDEHVIPLAEDMAYPAQPEDGYGWEKLFSERLCRHFREDYDLETRIARYHNIGGPMGTWRGGREKAPAALCRKVAEAKLWGSRHVEIWGDGLQTRSFCYVGDCVEGTRRLMESDYTAPLNIGSSELVSINQLLTIIEQIAGIEVERSYDLDAPQGVRGRNSDNTLCREVLGWEPATALADWLEITYRWVEQQVWVEGPPDR